MKKIILPLIIITFATSLIANAVIERMSADSQQNRIILQWVTSSEENVNVFVIERSTENNKHFVVIGELKARGPGFEYRFEDSELGNINSIFYYRLKIVNHDNSIQYTDVVRAIPNISSISRTWGSIKALFR